MNWTNKQIDAFSLRDREVLVSAAAGSGKTAVMVERVIKMVTEKPYKDIDRLLIVTFTKKAAESMRAKIRRELEKRLKADPFNEHLQRQMLLINHAYISTIDSFCSFIVKNYFYLTDNVSSNYRIGNDSEIKLIQADVLKEVLEAEYAKGEEGFLSFVDYFATGKNDLPLENVILSLYKYAQSHADPEKWLNESLQVYESFDLDSCGLNSTIRGIIDTYVGNALKLAEDTLQVVEADGGPYMYYDNFADDIRLLEEIKEADTLSECIYLLNTLKFSTLSRKKDISVSDELRAYCKEKRDCIKKNISEIIDIVAYDNIQNITDDILSCREQAFQLVRVTLLFSEALLAYKKKRNIFEHSDIAHFALNILRQENSPAKKQLSKLFYEIFIDEYQDSNRLQEELLYSIAAEVNGAHKIFMVGDVKQSIYSFRMACPDLFINKLKHFTEEESAFQKVFLSNNFRSRKQVVDFVNHIFSQLMEKSISGIEYDYSQSLVYSANYAPVEDESYKTEILHFEKDEEDIDTYEAEAYMIGSRIRELLSDENPFYISDRKNQLKRRLELKDICVLVRSQKDVVYPIKKILEDEFGYPVTCASVDAFFESFEIGFVVNYLKLLDNPYCDFPLVSVLMSPVVGITAEDMAEIRLEDKKCSIYELINKILASDCLNDDLQTKLYNFLNTFVELRALVQTMPLHKLVWKLYELTGLEAFVASMPSGTQRLSNLKRFVKYTIDFESTEYHSLFDFLRYIEKIIEYDIKNGNQEESIGSENSIKIMTMHKSKGLEFPVVFLAGLNKSFNFADERAAVLLHPESGLGFDCVDTEKRTKRKSLIKRLINKQMHIDKYGEEIRILYVAMTRAEEKLILCCCHSEKENITENSQINYFDILKGRRFWDWLRIILKDESDLYETRQYYYDDFLKVHEDNELKRKSNSLPEEIIDETYVTPDFDKNLGFVYQSDISDSFKKISVTFLKEQYNIKDEEGELQIDEPLIEKEVEFPVIPEFLKAKEGLSGAQRGLVYHSILEHWDYSLSSGTDDIKKFLNILLDKGILSEDETAVVNPIKLQKFLNNSIGKRMKEAFNNKLLQREASFSVILEHSNEGFNFLNRDVLLQGIIDAYFEEDGQLVIVDYKTDYLPEGDINYLVDKYSMQLKCYAYALEKITGKKVKETWIYSVYCDDSVKINS